MKRGLLWLLPLAGIAAIAWFLLSQGDEVTDSGDLGSDRVVRRGAAEDTTAHLQGREVARQARHTSPAGSGPHGIVVDEQDRPVSGVAVVALPWGLRGAYDETIGNLKRAFFGRPEPGVPVGEAITGSDGTFVLDPLPAAQSWVLEARPAPPFVGSRQTIWPSRYVGVPSEVRLRVWSGSALRLRVVGEAGGGLRAFVSARGPSPRSDRGYWQVPERETAADGRLALSAVPPPGVTLAVRVPHRVLVSGIPVETPTEKEVVVRIGDPTGASITGRVLDTQGQPVAGAQVLAVVVDTPKWTLRPRRTEAMAGSAADGTFEMRGLPAGHLLSFAGAAPGYCARTENRAPEKLVAGRATAVDLVLLKGAVLHGRVLDPDGGPIEGVRISVGPSGWRTENRFLLKGTSAADGTYRVEGLPPGNVFVAALAEGFYLPLTVAPHPFANPESGLALTIEDEGAELERDLVMKPGIPVRGRVVDARGEGVRGAVVTATGSGVPRLSVRPREPSPRATSDDDGHFSFAGLAPAPDWTFQARFGDLCSTRSEAATLAESSEAPSVLELVVRPSATLAGRVIDEAGQPVERAVVSLEPQNAVVSAHTDASGRFAFRGLPAGTYVVRVANVAGPSGAVRQERALAWGDRVDDVELGVPTTQSVSGVLVDEVGAPVTMQHLWLRPADPRTVPVHRSGYTDDEGAFEIQQVLPGRYRVVVDQVTLDTEVEAGDTDLRLVLPASAATVVEGTVLDPDRQPVVAGVVTVWHRHVAGGQSGSGAQITAGRFRVELSVDAETVDVEVQSAQDIAGRPLNTRPLRVNGVDPRDGPVELQLQEGLTLEGRVVDPAGHGVEGVRVAAGEVGRHIWHPMNDGGTVTGPDGGFRLTGLGDEEVAIHVQVPRDYAPPESVMAVPGAKDVVVRLKPAGSLRGRVIGPDGAGVAGAHVTVYWRPKDGGYQHRQATTGTDGTFSIDGLGTEAVRLSVGVPAGGATRWPYVAVHRNDVDPAAEEDLVITLEAGVWIEGQVVAPGGGAPGPGSVSAQGTGADDRRTHERATWAPDGSFAIGPIRAGAYQLRADGGGGNFRSSEDLTVEAPATGVRLVLQVGHVIDGRLLGDDVEGFRVSLMRTVGPLAGQASSVQAAADGSFRFGALEAVAEGVLFAHRDGDERCALALGVRAGGGPYDLRLEKGRTIAGRVELDDSEETGSASLSIFVKARGPHGVQVQKQLKGTRAFELKGLPPGTYRVSVHAWGGPVRLRFDPVDGVEAGTTNLVFVPR